MHHRHGVHQSAAGRDFQRPSSVRRLPGDGTSPRVRSREGAFVSSRVWGEGPRVSRLSLALLSCGQTLPVTGC